ncbi:MAG: ABC transporter permease [Rhodothermia bacterium]|nr:MAG: ABC transporter permease [Rhodothermia bacterium]
MAPWYLKFAWRDSRGSRRRMLLYMSSMVLGVAALVSINSFGDNLRNAIDREAETLLGADLSFESSRPFPEEIESVIDSLGGLQSRRISFSSMTYFKRTDDVRLSTVRAQEQGFPYYGAIETDPPEAATTFLTGKNALVDGTLMSQFDAAVGDSIRIGTISYRIAGKLIQTPRETAAIMLFSPRVYIPLAHLDESLLQAGSRADYEVYFRFPEGRDADAIVENLLPRLREAQVRTDTVEEEKEGWDRSLTNLYRFLSLVGFMSLLLGSLGVASSVHVYVRQRIRTVAILRCFGSRTWSTFSVYLIQAIGMGLIGAVFGSLLGLAIQASLPLVLGDFLPVSVDFSLSWSAVWLGSGIGLGVTVLFALLPLLVVKDVSPLLALRADLEADIRGQKSRLWWLVTIAIGLSVSVFAIIQSPTLKIGLGYSLSLLVVFGALAVVAKTMIRLLKNHTPTKLSYVTRQGIANLFRPHNQTLIMTLALGMGTFLIATILLSQNSLLKQMSLVAEGDRPNLVFFDIQSNQADGVEEELERKNLPVLARVPIVSMRISGINGTTISSMRADTTRKLSWAYRREYRSSYREGLTDSEVLIAGVMEPRVNPDTVDLIPVSIEEGIAGMLDVSLGDTVSFDIQGIEMDTRISSIRTVDWHRIQTNFYFIFPVGVLEEAPQFNVVLTRTETESESAAVQSAIVRRYANVSAIDISLVMNVFDAIFSRIAFIVRFMSLFTIITGLIVLSGAVLISRFQRIEESVLLKTIGASRSQVLRIMFVEYIALGTLAAAAGIILALGGGWALSTFVFEIDFVVPTLQLIGLVVFEVLMTLTIGLLNSRGVYAKKPLEVLRAEV